MDEALIERWLNLPNYRDDLISAGLGRDAESIRADTLPRIDAMQATAEAVFNNFLDLIGTPSRRRRAIATP
jgi:GMP synthase (glutamine-hydrolysing)